MVNHTHVHRLLQDAALGLADWHEALEAFAHATGAGRGQLIGIGPRHVSFNWLSGGDSGILDEFDAIDGANVQLSYRTAASIGAEPFTLVHEGHYAKARASLHNDIYVEFCDRVDLSFGNQTVVALNGDGFIGVATLRSRSDGVSTCDQRQAFSSLMGPVRSAADVQLALEGRGKDLLLGSFDAVEKAVLFLDRAGRCLAMTELAERWLGTTDAVTVHDQQVVCRLPADQLGWNKALAAVLERCESKAFARFRQKGRAPVIASLHAFSPPESSLGFRPEVLVVLQNVSVPSRAQDSDQWLRSLGLTAAESAIALMLARGVSRSDIAEQRGVRLVTVQQQIKAVYAKLDVNREAELVAMLFAGPSRGG